MVADAEQNRIDAERWRLLQRHWKTTQIRCGRDNRVRSVTLTVSMDHVTSKASQSQMDRIFDEMLAGERQNHEADELDYRKGAE